MNGDKLKAAFTAITDGYPIEEVSECLDWRDFEGLVSQILLENGFQVENNVILTKLSTKQTENQSGYSYTYIGFVPGDFHDIEVSGNKDGTTYTDTIQIFTRSVYPVTNFKFKIEEN